MKKRVFLICVLLLCLIVGGCAETGGKQGKYNIEEKVCLMKTQPGAKSEVTEGEFSIYFVDGGDIPYVKVSDYLDLYGSFFKDDNGGIPAAAFTYDSPADHDFVATRTDNEYDMLINAEKDTIEFMDYDRFISIPGSRNLISMVTIGESGVGGSSNLFADDATSYDRSGDYMTFDLSEYGIDLIVQDGDAYVPLQTMNDLLLNRLYILGLFNGEEVIFASASSELLDERYNVEPGEMSDDFAFFNYNELRFLLDSFYGLKPEHNIDNFGDFFDSTGQLLDLRSTDPKTFDSALKLLLNKYFDDYHSGFRSSSYLSGKTDPKDQSAIMEMLDNLGISSNSILAASIASQSNRAKYYPELNSDDASQNVCMYEEVGDTAILTFDTFSVNKDNYYTDADLEHPSDTIELVAYADKMIRREDSPIKNVVIDLSCNGGGNADAAAFLIAWLLGSANLAVKDTTTGAQTVAGYYADVNLDGTADEEDQIDVDNIYCLTSGASFSCGNLVPAALKDSVAVLLMGRTSAGGSCVVLPCSSASGATFQISGPMQLSTVRNGSFYNIDTGIEPDVLLSKGESFYDREKLVEIIHGLK